MTAKVIKEKVRPDSSVWFCRIRIGTSDTSNMVSSIAIVENELSHSPGKAPALRSRPRRPVSGYAVFPDPTDGVVQINVSSILTVIILGKRRFVKQGKNLNYSFLEYPRT